MVMRAFFVGLTFGLFFIGVQAAYAQAVPKTCDAQFHNVLRDKAWMEAQREVEVAEVILSQRHSVLDYTCFKNRADAFARSTVFGNNAAKTAAGTQSLQNYVNSILSGASSGCTAMGNVWKTIRCSDADKDIMFESLDDLISADPRSCSGASGSRDSDWNTANNNVFRVGGRDVADGGYDRVDAFLEEMDPTNCTGSAFVETGVLLDRSSLKDAVCLAPGCYADGGSCR
jgi:hypothetical protein